MKRVFSLRAIISEVIWLFFNQGIKSLNLIILCGFIFLVVVLFSGCATFHNVQLSDSSEVQFGLASWYGNKFHGKPTSSGEFYDMNDFTGAHRVLPFGTIIKVTNIKNGRSAFVKINDRGPQKSSRKLDISYAAAKKIGMINDGVARVKIEIVDDRYAFALYEQQKELWQAFNLDAYFGELSEPSILQASLPITQSRFLKESKFYQLGPPDIIMSIYDDTKYPNIMLAGISK